jgi:hypothetical protein
LEITDRILQDGEYVKEKAEKNIIFLHHTAGSHRADWTIDAWNRDRNSSNGRIRVATAFVVGGLDKNGTDKDGMDGKIFRAFDEDYWAYHLGLKTSNNTLLNKTSIGIEICNYGPLTKTSDGKYLTYVNSAVNESQVCDLGFDFKGYQYYQKYSDKQLESVRELMLYLNDKYGIELRCGLPEYAEEPNGEGFGLNDHALNGDWGVWSHTSVRTDKFDVYPQPELIQMLTSF